jgi:WD40 repeat protein
VREIDLSHRGYLEKVRFSPDSNRIGGVLGSDAYLDGHSGDESDLRRVTPGCVRLWDVRTGQMIGAALEESDWVADILFDQRGSRVIGFTSNRLRIWNASTSRSMTSIMEHSDDINQFELSPNNKYVATASRDGTGRVWDAATGASVTPPLTHSGKGLWWGSKGVTSIAFDAYSRVVATGGAEGSGRLWDIMSGQALSPILPYWWNVERVTVDSARQELSIQGSDRSVCKWDISPIDADAGLVALCNALAGRSLDTSGTLRIMSVTQLAEEFAYSKRTRTGYTFGRGAPWHEQLRLLYSRLDTQR